MVDPFLFVIYLDLLEIQIGLVVFLLKSELFFLESELPEAERESDVEDEDLTGDVDDGTTHQESQRCWAVL
jgi:hypothetical protein